MRVLDLFSGIGGFSVGLERAGMTTSAFCEVDRHCRSVLARHWPNVPIHGDVQTLRGEDLGPIDLVCGGFPCQDISKAGRGAGLRGERSGLFREVVRLVKELRPPWVILENVSALRSRGLDQVLGELSSLGYDAEWHCLTASSFGAPHRRDRIWIVAYPRGSRVEGPILREHPGPLGPWRWRGEEDMRLIRGGPFQRRPGHPQPLLRRMDDGLPGAMDRLRSLGNSLVPSIPEAIGRAIMALRPFDPIPPTWGASDDYRRAPPGHQRRLLASLPPQEPPGPPGLGPCGRQGGHGPSA